MQLFKNLEKIRSISATGFVDNIAILVKRKTCEENCIILRDLHEKICKPWALYHGSKFTPKKYQLSHFTQKRIANLESPLFFLGQTIFPQKMVTYLGILLDSKLSWNRQVIANKTKVLKSIDGLVSLAGSV